MKQEHDYDLEYQEPEVLALIEAWVIAASGDPDAWRRVNRTLKLTIIEDAENLPGVPLMIRWWERTDTRDRNAPLAAELPEWARIAATIDDIVRHPQFPRHAHGVEPIRLQPTTEDDDPPMQFRRR